MFEFYDDPAQMEPLVIDESRPLYHPLIGLAHELSEASACLDASLVPATAKSLAELVAEMNCYYSNLIEGNTRCHWTSKKHCSRPRNKRFSETCKPSPVADSQTVVRLPTLVRTQIPATSQAGRKRAPAVCAVLICWTMVWRSSRPIIRPRPCPVGRSPRVFLTVPTRRLSRPAPCPSCVTRAPVP